MAKYDLKKIREMSAQIANISKYSTIKKKDTTIVSPYVKKPFAYPFDIPKKVNTPISPVQQIKVINGKDGRTPTKLEISSLINEILRNRSAEIRGINGLDGKTPSRKELMSIVAEFLTLYEDRFKGNDGVDGKTPTKEELFSVISDIFNERKNDLKGQDGVTPVLGVDYEIQAETPESIAQKINTLEQALDSSVIKGLPNVEDIIASVIKELKTGKNRLEAKDIINLPQFNSKGKNKGLNMNDMRWHGSGVPGLTAGTNITITTNTDGTLTISSVGGSGFTILDVAGVIDDNNVTFTVASQPTLVNINGAFYRTTGGAITWTYLAGTITLSDPVGINGFIYALA